MFPVRSTYAGAPSVCVGQALRLAPAGGVYTAATLSTNYLYFIHIQGVRRPR